jgi:3-oxoacyl-[acyl-carrier protein] reductase
MTAELKGRTALVTGGSRGIGAAIAKRLAEAGADVALTYQSHVDRAESVVAAITGSGRRGLAIAADSGDPAAVRAAVQRTVGELGRIDILVNNAGVSVQKPVDELTLEEIDRTLDVNVRAPLLAAQEAARHMGQGGRVITIASNVTERTPFPTMTLYALSKTALIGLTKGLARDLGPREITANLVSPGPIDTEMNPADGPNAAAVNDLIPRGRYGTADDVAWTVVHLAGPAGRNINGANVAVDGGITA